MTKLSTDSCFPGLNVGKRSLTLTLNKLQGVKKTFFILFFSPVAIFVSVF